MYFQSDNWAGAHPLVAAGLQSAAEGFAPAYGDGELDRRVRDRFCALFERDVAVFFVGTGTAANALSLASLRRPGGAVFCHGEAHLVEDECGAPEAFSGMRMVPVGGAQGRLDLAALRSALAAFSPDAVHHGRAAAISVTQASEAGTLYSLAELQAVGDVARAHGIALHMDGARFANALVALDATPADMTWRRGVDILSFGATKNGCWCAEAIIVFDPARAADMPFIQKGAAQLFSKSRFIAAQFDAYLKDDLWLDLARHANRMADRLRQGLGAPARLAWATRGNEVFAVVSRACAETAWSRGAHFYEWPTPAALAGAMADGDVLIRLVTSFATTDRHVDDLLTALVG